MKHKSNKTASTSEVVPIVTEKHFPDTTTERTIFTVLANSNSIHHAVARTFGLSAWFKAYAQSDEFAKLSNEWKAEAFEAYEGVKRALELIEQDTAELENEYPNFI